MKWMAKKCRISANINTVCRQRRFHFRSERGLTKEIVEEISRMKEEPQWMLDFRLKSLEHFYNMPMPQWGGDLNSLNFDEITYYVKPSERSERSWDEVPEEIKQTFDKLGIPEAEQNIWPVYPRNMSQKSFTIT
ncbi:hypothetical protein PO124_07400 [Bacillus licheniformis]|nr:hypothetical protein [Bacillus licheniformis]